MAIVVLPTPGTPAMTTQFTLSFIMKFMIVSFSFCLCVKYGGYYMRQLKGKHHGTRQSVGVIAKP